MSGLIRRQAFLPFTIIAIGEFIRHPCLHTDLWFDEVWSVKLVREAGTLGGVLFGIHHDNSHPLNSLWIWIVGPDASWPALRAASSFFGLLTVLALWRDKEDPAAGLLAASLGAVSAPLVLFSTEARGYAGAMACALACRLLLKDAVPSWRRTTAFGFLACLGFFSHPTFLFAFAGLFAWAWAMVPRARRMRDLLALFAPAPVLLVVYALLQWGPPQMGNGGVFPFFPSLLTTLAQWAGAPDAGPLAWAGAAAMLALCGAELARLRREKDPELRFYAVLLGLNVVFFAAIPYRFPRYFAISAPFALILCARTLIGLLRRSGAARAAALSLLALGMIGSAARDLALATAGRGHYWNAVMRMAAETPGNVITVAGDHRLREPVMLEYYERFALDKKIEYVGADRRREHPADWYVLHSLSTDPAAAPVALSYPGGPFYDLVAVYPYSGMSGWSWWLYRREAAPSAPVKRTSS